MPTQLPKGVTGFWSKGEPPLPLVEKRSIVAACHAAAMQTNAEVVATSAGSNADCRNFGFVTCLRRDSRVSVLLNNHIAIAGLAVLREAGSSHFVQSFVDDVALSDALGPKAAANGWRLLSKAELDQPLDAASLVDLGPAEKKQIEYWKPVLIGSVIFNNWD